ncbi:hypothetical protein GCM10027341_34350 [Spirosoma knui]
MRLPNVDRAAIPDRKIIEYLLDHAHPQNKGKAAFYELVGFSKANATALKTALVRFAEENGITRVVENEYGNRYIIEG